MYRRPAPGSTPIPPRTSANPQLANSILQSVATQAQANVSTRPQSAAPQATQSLTSPMHIITNPPAFNSFIKTHRAAVGFFTSTTCGPCKMIEPAFERLSEEKGSQDGRNGAGFAMIDIDVGMGQALAAQWNVRATPTFMFFLDGQKVKPISLKNSI